MGKASKRKRIRRNEKFFQSKEVEGSLIVEVYDEKGKDDFDIFYGRKFDWLEVPCGSYVAIFIDARFYRQAPQKKHD